MTTPAPTDPAEPAASPTRPAARPWFLQPVIAVVSVAAVLLALQWFDSHRQMSALQSELSQRLSAADAENRGTAEQAGAAARDLETRLAALEARFQESSRSRDDALITEIEQTLLLAGQQLQLAGNPRAALAVLQTLDTRLAGADPAFGALRKAVARDVERLKAAPQIDIAAFAARLDEVAATIDGLPLMTEPRSPETAAARKTAPADGNAWTRLAREFWHDLSDLLRIQRIDAVDAVPLAPSQAYFLRETLRLRLLGARVALLARNDKSYRADLKATRDWLTRYFDARSESVAAALATVRQLQEHAAGIDPLDLAGSLDAVRALRARR